VKKATNAQFSRMAATCCIAAAVLTANSSARSIDSLSRPEGISTDWKQINSNVLSDEFSFWALPNVQEQKAMPGIELILSWHGAQLVISECAVDTTPPRRSRPTAPIKNYARKSTQACSFTRTGRTTAGGRIHIRFNMTPPCKDQAGIDTAKRIVASLEFNRMVLLR
jgi:hypothetical protein